MANKRKTTTAIIAGVSAAALLLGGTFAWTSISQQAKNETAGIVNVGGRLHDDFDGENKDVYVENFTDPLNGGQPIYARIKLTEYMEVGQDAGGFGSDVDGDDKIEVVPVVNGTNINDKDNWPVHIPVDACTTCENGDTCAIHDHWEWTMGGQTVFMPTFNKDKDSLAADINGTYHGTDDTDKIYYDDYVTYITEGGIVVDVINNTATNADGTAIDITGTDALTEVTGSVTTVTGSAYYDDDADNETNDHDTNTGGFKTETETHTAKQTSTASVMTMQAWIEGGKIPGNYWVYDTDGWAYWANPIMPGEATGLLLDGIKMTYNPGEKCYYAINVVAEFATVGDWEYFTGIDEEDNANALELLETVSKNVATVVVTNVSGKANLEHGDEVIFSASISTAADTATLAAGDFEWSVLNKNLSESTTSEIVENDDGTATLKVGEGERKTELIIVAKATDDKYLGAMGMSTVAVRALSVAELVADIEPGSTDTAIIDDIEWYVLAKEQDKVLLLSKDTLGEKTGQPQKILDSWLSSYDTLNRYAVPTTVPYGMYMNGPDQYISTETARAFSLSAADVGKVILDGETTYQNMTAPGGTWAASYQGTSDGYWLRSSTRGANCYVNENGEFAENSWTIELRIRPALWISLDPDADYSNQ